MPRQGEAVAADGTEVRQHEGCAVILADIAARGFAIQVDGKFDAARDNGDLPGFDGKNAKFRSEERRVGKECRL